MKIVTIIENNHITGIVYGVKEVPDNITVCNRKNLIRQYQKTQTKKAAILLKRAERTKKK